MGSTRDSSLKVIVLFDTNVGIRGTYIFYRNRLQFGEYRGKSYLHQYLFFYIFIAFILYFLTRDTLFFKEKLNEQN